MGVGCQELVAEKTRDGNGQVGDGGRYILLGLLQHLFFCFWTLSRPRCSREMNNALGNDFFIVFAESKLPDQ